jgi:hypothetical protein
MNKLKLVNSTRLTEKCHSTCNICYHIGWLEGGMIKGCDVLAYAGHIILKKNIVKPYNINYCSECDTDNNDSTSIVKKDVITIDTICNARLNLCLQHIEQLKEQNSIC